MSFSSERLAISFFSGKEREGEESSLAGASFFACGSGGDELEPGSIGGRVLAG